MSEFCALAHLSCQSGNCIRLPEELSAQLNNSGNFLKGGREEVSVQLSAHSQSSGTNLNNYSRAIEESSGHASGSQILARIPGEISKKSSIKQSSNIPRVPAESPAEVPVQINDSNCNNFYYYYLTTEGRQSPLRSKSCQKKDYFRVSAMCLH